MIDADLFSKRLRKIILRDYKTIGDFAEKFAEFASTNLEGENRKIHKQTVYRWASETQHTIPHPTQRKLISDFLEISQDYLFPPPAIGLDANYYIGYLEGLLLTGKQQENVRNKIVEDEAGEKYWLTLRSYKEKHIVRDIEKTWGDGASRKSLSQVLEELSQDDLHKEYFVDLVLLLAHYMGGNIKLYDLRIELSKKAAISAKELSDAPLDRSDYFKSASYLLNIDALAWMYMKTNRISEAIDLLETMVGDKYLESKPNIKALRDIFLARAYMLDKRKDRIEEVKMKLGEVNPYSNKITNDLVRIRYMLVLGDLCRKENSPKEASLAYEIGIKLQEALNIDTMASGLGYRLGHAYVDIAKASDDFKHEVWLSNAQNRFEQIISNDTSANSDTQTIDEYHAIFGLARIAELRREYSTAQNYATEVQEKLKALRNIPGAPLNLEIEVEEFLSR
ncbi:MAG: hypothetical protein IT327_13115 [Anaerolineae bacterium]|nr:hypothetical protein [Anaerolineae bacterium]